MRVCHLVSCNGLVRESRNHTVAQLDVRVAIRLVVAECRTSADATAYASRHRHAASDEDETRSQQRWHIRHRRQDEAAVQRVRACICLARREHRQAFLCGHRC